VVDRQKLSTRLDALDGYLVELASFRSVSREEFSQEGTVHHLAERFLHLACECVLDIAQHVIADQGYRQALLTRMLSRFSGVKVFSRTTSPSGSRAGWVSGTFSSTSIWRSIMDFRTTPSRTTSEI
jgi:Protein of unknown function DUF86